MFPLITTNWWKYFKWWLETFQGVFQLKFDQIHCSEWVTFILQRKSPSGLPTVALKHWKQTSYHLRSFQEVFVSRVSVNLFLFLDNSCLTLTDSIHDRSISDTSKLKFFLSKAIFTEIFVQIDFSSFVFVFKTSVTFRVRRINRNFYSKLLMEINHFFCSAFVRSKYVSVLTEQLANWKGRKNKRNFCPKWKQVPFILW